jgi:hypothetical protein
MLRARPIEAALHSPNHPPRHARWPSQLRARRARANNVPAALTHLISPLPTQCSATHTATSIQSSTTRTSKVLMGCVAGGFIARPDESSKRAPCSGHAIHVRDIRPHSSFSFACEQMFEIANRRSLALQINIDLPATSTAFFVPGGMSATLSTRAKELVTNPRLLNSSPSRKRGSLLGTNDAVFANRYGHASARRR